MNPIEPKEGSPPGEIELFEALAAAPGTEQWIAIHSVRIPNHPTQVEGEGDFVVFVPGEGVLVIEVKSHARISRGEDGRWRLGRDEPRSRSPFDQANEVMHALLSTWKAQDLPTIGFPIAHAVWFSRIAKEKIPQAEWHSWQVLDSRDLKLDPKGAILRTLRKAAVHLEQSARRLTHAEGKPTSSDIERLARSLRPGFLATQTTKDAAESRSRLLERYLIEQLEVLEATTRNQQILLSGAAGTGKTHVALEYARREHSDGKTILFLCFNNLLSKHLRTEAARFGLTDVVSTIHALMLKISGLRVPHEAPDSWWNVVLPAAAIEKLLVDDSQLPTFDVLVVDEAQDLVTPQNMDFIDLLVSGGVGGVRSFICGDFEGQGIFSDGIAARHLSEMLQPRAVILELHTNCRNTMRIGHYTNTYAGLAPGYNKFRRPDDGIKPSLRLYGADSSSEKELVILLRMFLDENFAPQEIVILSRRKDSTCARATSPWLRDRLGRDIQDSKKIRWGTIHEFKGLEAAVVIVTDCDLDLQGGHNAFLYIAMTRATSRLGVVAPKAHHA
jgi:hypothetical protein